MTSLLFNFRFGLGFQFSSKNFPARGLNFEDIIIDINKKLVSK